MSATNPSIQDCRVCPICGSGSKDGLFRQRFSGPEGHTLITGYQVCTCGACGFAYADGIPSQDALDVHYREMSKYEHQVRGGEESERDRARFLQTAECLTSLCPDRSIRILEVGCSTGGFLAILREKGYSSLMGLDPSPACTDAAHRLYGLQVRNTPVSELRSEGNLYDLIVLLEVLEHVRDLAGFTRALRASLSPAGALYVQVPDASRFAEHSDAPFQQFSNEHINFFSRLSMRNLMAMNGFLEKACVLSVVQEGLGVLTPVLDGLYIIANSSPTRLERDEETDSALRAYIQASKKVDRGLHLVLSRISSSGRKVIIWGAGTHTQRLLAEGRFEGIHVTAFVDSNPHLQGKVLAGKRVLSPSELEAYTEALLVSSRVFQDEIVRQIRQELRLPNEIVTLYEVE